MTPEVPLIVPDTHQDISYQKFPKLELSLQILNTTLGGTAMSVNTINQNLEVDGKVKKRLLRAVLRAFPDFEEARRFHLRPHEYYGQAARKK